MWNTDNIEKLTMLWATGASCSVIAAELGQGFTRNSVIGKVRRLGLALRGRPAKQPAERRERKQTKRGRPPVAGQTPKTASEPFVCRVVEAEPLHLPLSDLGPDDCRWPYGINLPYTFCGRPKSSRWYCAAHHALSVGPGTVAERNAVRNARKAA